MSSAASIAVGALGLSDTSKSDIESYSNIFVMRWRHGSPRISVALSTAAYLHQLGEIEVATPISSMTGALAQTAWALHRNSQSAIVVSDREQCEEVIGELAAVGMLSRQIEEAKGALWRRHSKHRSALFRRLRNEASVASSMAEAVHLGVGFDHCDTPPGIRKALARAFASGSLDFHVTSATLPAEVAAKANCIILNGDQPLDQYGGLSRIPAGGPHALTGHCGAANIIVVSREVSH